MNRMLPSPALSIGLFLLWLLLAQSISPGTLVLGAVLAVFWPAVTGRLMSGPLRIRKPLLLVALVARVISDMLRSNLALARVILTRRPTSLPSAFVRVPLELRDPKGLAALAMIVTFIPGTAWAQLSLDGRVLLLHVPVVDDERDLIASIKRRYEHPLREIFE